MHISPIDLNHWSFYCFPHYHSFHFFTLTFPRVPSWKKSYFWWCCQLLKLSCWQKNKSRRQQRLFCPDDPPSPWRTWPRRGWRQQRWLISGRIDGNFFQGDRTMDDLMTALPLYPWQCRWTKDKHSNYQLLLSTAKKRTGPRFPDSLLRTHDMCT